MASLNRVFLAGNLTREPEVRYLPSGSAVTEFGLAANRRYRTAGGEDREETCFVGIVAFGKQAETCGKYLHKGSPAMVEGRLHYDEWEKDGKKSSRLRVVAERVHFLSGPGGGDGGRMAQAQAPMEAGQRGASGGPGLESGVVTRGDAAESDEAGASGRDVDNLPF